MFNSVRDYDILIVEQYTGNRKLIKSIFDLFHIRSSHGNRRKFIRI